MAASIPICGAAAQSGSALSPCFNACPTPSGFTRARRNPSNAIPGNERGIVERKIWGNSLRPKRRTSDDSRRPITACELNVGVLYIYILAYPRKALDQFEHYSSSPARINKSPGGVNCASAAVPHLRHPKRSPPEYGFQASDWILFWSANRRDCRRSSLRARSAAGHALFG